MGRAKIVEGKGKARLECDFKGQIFGQDFMKKGRGALQI